VLGATVAPAAPAGAGVASAAAEAACGAAVVASPAGALFPRWPSTTMAMMPATIEKIATVTRRRRGLGALAGRPAGAWLFISVGPWVR
jgi:hypothetical protein